MRYKKLTVVICAFAVSGMLFAGCGQQKAPAQQAMKVNAFHAVSSDTPILYEYVGQVIAQQEVPVRSRVSGSVIEKYVSGGEEVTEGQPLYRIDTRQYESAVNSARASAAQAGATYENSVVNLGRYDQLIGNGAVSQQTYDNQKSETEQYGAALDATNAQVRIAEDNLSDTVVRAPFSGRLSLDDVNIGTYATAGSTALVTISSTDPVYVQFDISENEYLTMTKKLNGEDAWGDALKLKLSDGSIYSETGKVVQINPGMSSGQLTLKAAFPNPNRLLVPGMYGTIVSDTEIAPNSILVPTKAIIQLLNKNMVDVVTADDKVEQKPIVTAGTYGIYTVVKSGLSANDNVIVEGQAKVRIGQSVDPTELTKDQVEQSASQTADK